MPLSSRRQQSPLRGTELEAWRKPGGATQSTQPWLIEMEVVVSSEFSKYNEKIDQGKTQEIENVTFQIHNAEPRHFYTVHKIALKTRHTFKKGNIHS